MTDFIKSTFQPLFVLAMQTEEHRALSNLILKIIFFPKLRNTLALLLLGMMMIKDKQ